MHASQSRKTERKGLTFGSMILPSSPTSVMVSSFRSRNLKGSVHDRLCTTSITSQAGSETSIRDDVCDPTLQRVIS
jgi:hypothetical protein